MSMGIPPLIPLPGQSNFLIQIVPRSNRYHFRLSGYLELFRHEATGNISVGKEDFTSLSELLRSTEKLLKKELKRNRPASVTIRTLINDYLARLFPDARDEIGEDLREASSPILQDVRGIGPKVAEELRKHGITEIRQLARAPEEVLQQDVKFLGEKTAKRVKEEAQMKLHKKKSEQNKLESIQALQDRLTKSNK